MINKSQLDTINQNLSTTSDVTFNTGPFTEAMTITGDLTVLGSSTEISSTELRIEDKLITVTWFYMIHVQQMESRFRN